MSEPRPDRPREPETIIEVGGDEPEIVEPESRQPWQHVPGADQTRVFVARGSGRSCLIPIAALLLLLVCVCVGIWGTFDLIF